MEHRPEQQPKRSEPGVYLASVNAFESFKTNVNNVLQYAAPEVPQDVKDRVREEVEILGDNVMGIAEGLEYESILPDKREEAVRNLLEKELLKRISDMEMLEDQGLLKQEKIDFMESLTRH